MFFKKKTCFSNPNRYILKFGEDEVIGNVPIDIQIESHGANIYMKNQKQPKHDQSEQNPNMTSKSLVVRNLDADNIMFGSLTSYSRDSMKGLIYRRWNNRLKNLSFYSTFEREANEFGFLPKPLNKANSFCFVQILSQHCMLGSFQFQIGRCFTTVYACMHEEKST